MTDYTAIVVYAIGNGQTKQSVLSNTVGALNCMHDKEAVIIHNKENEKYVVRRVTPTECARLQGMPDWWCDDIPHKDTPEYKMWGNGVALPCALYIMEGFALQQ